MNWILSKLLALDFIPGKKRIVSGGVAIVLGWIQLALANVPADAGLPPAPMASIEESLTWAFSAATALFVYGAVAALARGALKK